MKQYWIICWMIIVLISNTVYAANRSITDGKYVIAKDGHLWYDGQRIRFWGVCLSCNVKRYGADQDLSMDRLVDAGFNAIRLNLTGGMFAENPETQGYSYKIPKTVVGSKNALDRLDYAIYAARKRGVFFWLQFDRAETKFKPGDYDLLPDDGTRDQWNEALKIDDGLLVYFYDRAGKVYMEYAKNILEHVNPYTGKRYADEEAIAMWEMFNEFGFLRTFGFCGDFTKDWPVFLKEQVKQRWNAWLVDRYRSEARLKKAWGSLLPGESLEQQSIAFGPLDADVKVLDAAGYQPSVIADYKGKACSSQRAEDILRFLCFIYNDYNQRFIQHVRSVGKRGQGINVVPIAPTGSFDRKWVQYFACNNYDFVTTGVYGFAAQAWKLPKTDPFYPFIPFVNQHPSFPQPVDIVRPAGKPYLIYECGDYIPNPYTIEFPMFIATNLIRQDADGAFWFYWDDKRFSQLHTDEDYLSYSLPTPVASYPNAGLILGNNEVFLAAAKSMGQIFLSGQLPPAAKPVQVCVGKDLLFNRNQPEMSPVEDILRLYAWRDGVEINYDPEGTSKLPPAIPMPKGQLQSGKFTTFNWKNNLGTIRIDAPTAKAQVGFTGTKVEFGDLKISSLNRKFSYVGVIAEDGLPLEKSNSILISLTSANHNKDLIFDPSRMTQKWGEGLAEAVVNPGTAPVVVERLSAKIQAPWLKGKIVERHNFLRDIYHKATNNDGVLTVSANEPMFYIRVRSAKLTLIRKLVVAGNSITRHSPLADLDWTGDWGMAASCKEKDFAHLLCQRITQLQEHAPQLIIENYPDSMVIDPQHHAKIASISADLYIIQIGDNLVDEKCNEETLAKPYSDLLQRIRRSNPHAQIVGIGTWGGGKNRNHLIQAACTKQNVPFVSIEEFSRNPKNLATTFKNQGVAWHPNDTGMSHIADAVWNTLKDIGEFTWKVKK